VIVKETTAQYGELDLSRQFTEIWNNVA